MTLAAWMYSINQLIEAHAGEPWVLIALAALCTIDGFFPPVPSESLVVGLAAVGRPPWWLLAPVAALGAVCGDNIAFLIGRRLGHTRMLNGGRRRVKTVVWARRQLRRRGPLCILVARYIPGGRVIVNAMAGATGFSYRVFLAVDVIAGILWSAYSVAIGTGTASVVGGNHMLAMAVGIVLAVAIGAVLDQILRRLMPVRAEPGDEETLVPSGDHGQSDRHSHAA
ncbi:DedA family protein [Acidipropionibacterium acidipropionici]|jgi:membrane protein DedA with SNARE-associated domain|uniref:DedA family protein n=1 Tax=Acidipropionibacterium acidipropionici TaxID=1748 RepID=UPI00110A3569|nr:DedA family protein [Acidipropionibacterium acidipropionici]QCV95426.1 DedA family protein [Acidipropionibacterium acidipropionici]